MNYKPWKVGFALSEKDGWYVGKRRFCGPGKAREFQTRQAAENYIANRYDGDRFEFVVHEVQAWGE